MIDNMSLKVENFSQKEWSEISNELEFLKISPEKNSGMLSNLKFQYFPNVNELLIQNSLHKFFNSKVKEIPIGKHNYDDFDIDKLKMAGVYLSEFVNRKFTDFELIGRFEYGLNINVSPKVPMDILNNYFSYSSTRTNPFVTHGVRRGKPYGRSCYLTDFRIKFYDKSNRIAIVN